MQTKQQMLLSILCSGASLLLVDLAAAQAQATWTPARVLSGYLEGAAYDGSRQRIVVFGGSEGNETWELDGVHWTRRSPANSPGSGQRAMVYDAARQRVLRFGGGSGRETWEWDGDDWTQRSPATSPGGPALAMAFDSGRGRVVLFGGTQGTWEWDGVDWTHLPTPVGPGVVDAMTYDAGRQRIVAIGGWPGGASQTWEWDGSNWTLRSPATVPIARLEGAMAYDAARQRVVLFGGSVPQSWSSLADTWEWDGSDWIPFSPAASPSARAGHALVFDETAQRVVLLGGTDFRYDLLSDVWEWDGTNWTQRAPRTSPVMGSHAMAYDSGRQRVMLFTGGSHGTWEWDGRGWSQRTTTVSPGFGRGPMAYDAARRRMVLFQSAPVAETWEWDGSTWLQRTPAASPRAGGGYSIVYDSGRQRVTLFAGDTWEWDGRDWSRRPTTVSPPAFGGPMAYDAARQRVVLFGSRVGAVSGETWEWDGNNWARIPTASDPGGREYHAMTYDSARQRVVLFGGRAGDNQGNWSCRSTICGSGTAATGRCGLHRRARRRARAPHWPTTRRASASCCSEDSCFTTTEAVGIWATPGNTDSRLPPRRTRWARPALAATVCRS